jgi:hypothetical protein
MKRKLLVAVPLLCLVAVLAWVFRPKHESLGEGYISERSVTLWSSVAQVREPMDTLHYGDHVEILARRNDNAKVRTAAGEVGWIDGRLVMEPALWQRSAVLLKQAQVLTVQAKGRTKVSTNLRVEPGRTQPRLYQFGRGVAVEIVGRAVADWAQTADEKETPSEANSNSNGNAPKKEEWFLVRALATRPPGENNPKIPDTTNTTRPGDQSVPIAGWIVARFVELDLPDAVRTGTASANVRPVAWFELIRSGGVPAGEKPNYLVASQRGPEGQICDFTNIRVFTWDAKKDRYETAYNENNLCGQMPVRLARGPKDEPEFRFRTKEGAGEERVYRLIQTVVRRIHTGDDAPKPAATKKAHTKSTGKSAAKSSVKKKKKSQ